MSKTAPTPEASFELLSETLDRLAPNARPSIVPRTAAHAAEKALKKQAVGASECGVCGRSTGKVQAVAVWKGDASTTTLTASQVTAACRECSTLFSPTGVVDCLASGSADDVRALARRCVEANYAGDADDIAVRKQVDLLEQVASTAYALRVMAGGMGEWSVRL